MYDAIELKNQQNDLKNYIYLKAWSKVTKEYMENPDTQNRIMNIKKCVFYGVKYIITNPEREQITREQAERDFYFVSVIKSLIALLTPGQFIEVFPIEKEYKGHKLEMKDYFYTRDYINTLDPNKPIGDDEVSNFLWKFHNWEMVEFSVNMMRYMSNLRRLDGYPSIMEEWANMNGIQCQVVQKDHKGNHFIIKDGKVLKARKSKPRYLKVVK